MIALSDPMRDKRTTTHTCSHHMAAFHCSVINASSEVKHDFCENIFRRVARNVYMTRIQTFSLSSLSQRSDTHKHTLVLPYVLDFTTSPPHSSRVSLIPGRGSSPRCLCLNSKDSGIIQKFHGTYLVPPRRQWRGWKMPPRSPALSPSIVSTL